jgi:hypothetical protein
MVCVLPVVVHLRDTLLFVHYIVRAMGDLPFGFFEATEVHRAIHNATYNKDWDTALTLSSIFRDTPERGRRSMLSASQKCHEGCRGKRHTHSITSSAGQNVMVFDHFYFFLSEAKVGCHAAAFRLGAAAITFILSFFGFLASRLPLCWPFAMSISLGLRKTQIGCRVG